jgi:integrase
MATLIKQHGRYYLQFYDKHRSPKRKRVPLKVTRKREAKKHKRRLERKYREQEFDPWTDDPFTLQKKDEKPKTLKEALSAFLSAKEEAGRSENTIRSYRGIIRRLTEQVGEQSLLQSLSADEITTYVRDPEIAETTQHKRYRHIKAFLRWCLAKNLITRNPLDAVQPPDQTQKLPKVMTEKDLERICTALREDYEVKRAKGRCREGQLIWYIPLFRFAFYTGMRASELGRLRWDHIDFDRGLIYIYKQKNKKEQTIPLIDKAREVLKGLEPGDPEEFVFTSPRQTSTERSIRAFRDKASRTFLRARRQAEIDRPITFHSLRHGFCTMLAQAGKPAYVIKAAARHADIQTSMIYVNLSNEHLKSELDDAFGD